VKRRKLTPFLAHEMLFDYATNQLDADRRQAVEEFIKTDRESQTILANIEASLAYAEKLSATKVDPEILVHLKEAESAISLGKKYSSWSAWPESLRWSITAIGLSALVAGIVAVVPWSRFTQKPQATAAHGPESVEVAQIPEPTADELEAQNAVADNEGSGDEPPDDAGDEGSGDEHDDGDVPPHAAAAVAAAEKPEPPPKPSPTPSPTPVVAKATATPEPTATPAVAKETPAPTPAEVASNEAPKVHYTPYFLAKRNPFATFNVQLRFIPDYIVPPHVKPAETPVPVQVAENDAPKPPAAPTPKAETAKPVAVAASDEGTSEQGSREEKPRGFVYRAFMTLPDLEDVGPKITEDLLSLGAEKAGEVELGWKRGTGRYYHFELPEENEKKVLERLQVYGPVRISKDPHPRIMPEGQVRFILWVESAD
jgi:hypothetical protein